MRPSGLAIGDWVTTTAEGLRLRQAPGTGGAEIGLLRAGYTGTIIDGPIEADGYEWVLVVWPGLPAQSGCATGPGPGGFLDFCGANGWLATSDAAGTTWVERAEPDCPDVPTTVRAATEMQPGLRLACFRGEELRLVGYIAPQPQGRGCYPGYDHDPEWLGPCAVAFLQGIESQFDASPWELAVNVHPDAGTCHFGGASPDTCPFISHVGSWVAVTGRFDHPDAESCVIRPWEGNAFAPDAAFAVYSCRERFAVTSIAPASAP